MRILQAGEVARWCCVCTPAQAPATAALFASPVSPLLFRRAWRPPWARRWARPRWARVEPPLPEKDYSTKSVTSVYPSTEQQRLEAARGNLVDTQCAMMSQQATVDPTHMHTVLNLNTRMQDF